MVFIYFISSLITNSIYYIDLSRLHDKKISNKKLLFIMFCGSIAIAFFNTVKKNPTLNLLINLTYFICVAHFLFNHKRLREYIPDAIIFMVIVLLDGILYTIFQSVITVEINKSSELFFTFASSLSIFFINLGLNKFIIKNDLYNIPGMVIILFFFTVLLHIIVVGILNIEIAVMQGNEYFEMISIGLVFTDLTLFHYLDYIEEGHRKEKDNLLRNTKDRLTTQYYENLKEKYNQQRKLIHDFDNHIQAITKAYQNNNDTLAKKITNDVVNNYNKSTLSINSTSEILNIIINDKMISAEKKGINFEFFYDTLVDFSFINEFDMITIFGNLLDNAIEANLKINADRLITMKIYQVNSMLIIFSKNNYNSLLNYNNNRIVSTKKDHHGCGLDNIESTIKKYNGLIEYTDNLGFFEIKIAIPVTPI